MKNSNANQSDRNGAILATASVAAFILGIVFWTGFQFVTPVIENLYLDVFILPILASMAVTAAFWFFLPRVRPFIWWFPLGTIAYSVFFFIVLI